METILHNDESESYIEAFCKTMKISAMNARRRNINLEKAINFIENQRNKKKNITS